MTSEQLIQVLTTFYQDPRHENVYAGRWDVWCIQNNNWNAYHMLILKSDDQLNRLLTQAREKARGIENSPLTKALS